MKRIILNNLIEWKISNRRKPLILQGARQVGKTHILKKFALSHYERMAYFNFEDEPALSQIFEKNLKPERILSELGLHCGFKITAPNCLVIFDEIQECPAALTSLKYFDENASQYHIVCAGSLLGIKMARSKGFPVGKVNFLHLYPLSFLEFLEATGQSNLLTLIEELTPAKPLLEIFHGPLIDAIKTYIFVGGMPEVVDDFSRDKDFNKVRLIQDEILKTYQLDFAKHAPPADVAKISAIWQNLPQQLAKENKKFQISSLKKGARFSEYENALQWLLDAGLVYRAEQISIPHLPLPHYSEKNIFKLYAVDVGLLGAMSGLSGKVIVLGDQLLIEFKGALTENLVAQELKTHFQSPLHYWSSPGIAEVDFVLQIDDKIYPLEVKSGLNNRSRSLGVYAQKYKPPKLFRTSFLGLKQDEDLISLPLYALSSLRRLV